MALRNVLTLRRPRSGRLEGRTALIRGPFSVSSVVELRHDCVQRHLWGVVRYKLGHGGPLWLPRIVAPQTDFVSPDSPAAARESILMKSCRPNPRTNRPGRVRSAGTQPG